MMHKLMRYAALAGAVVLGACELDVQNPNQPETERVLATPKDAEALLGSYYRRWHSAMYGSLSNVWGMAAVMSFEDYSSLANNCMNARAGIPRPTNDNSISNACSTEQHRVYFIQGEVARVASNVLTRFESPGYTLGPVVQDNRAKAFAEFLRGLSHGYLALFYDSAAVVVTEQDPEDPGVLVGYQEVMDSAIAALDRAITHARAATGQEIPQSWIPTSTGSPTLNMANFERLIRSYRARFRANLARTPAERAAADWTAIIDDATNGITVDHDNITSTTVGPNNSWVNQFHQWGLWHQMPPWVIGMADTSGSYAAWMALPLESRGTGGAFFMVTPDRRFPQGETRAAQQADFAVTSCEGPSATCLRYFRNRPLGNDQSAGLTWGQSNYDFVRYISWRISGSGTGQNGPLVFFKKAELDMLAAEGHLRAATPNYAAAAALINVTRTATGAGLPAVTATVSGGLTGNACVPKMPVNATSAGGGTVVCGNLWEAMKYEKRIETLQTHFAAWYLDMRGWGDLPQGTPTHWAPPYQELQARKAGIYSIGTGTTGGGASGPSTYGW